MQKLVLACLVAVVCCGGLAAAADGVLKTPPQLWADYDPDAGDFNEEILAEATKDGIYSRDSYISCYVLGSEIRVYCLYKVKASELEPSAMRAPGLLNVHGWMGAAAIPKDFVDDGWAVMSFDYCVLPASVRIPGGVRVARAASGLRARQARRRRSVLLPRGSCRAREDHPATGPAWSG